MLPGRAAGASWFCAAVLFWLTPPLPAAQPGDIVRDVDGLTVAPSQGAARQRIVHGSPALVLAVDGQWTRLLAADATSGWTDRRFTNAVPARIAVGGSIELSDRSPDQPSIREGIETFQIPAKDASIAGASLTSRVGSLRQLMLPARCNPFLTPWLEIRSGSRTGWIVPSDLPLEWGEPLGGDNLAAAMDALGLNGIVRRPFLAAVEPLAGHARQTYGTLLEFETISSKPVRGQPAGAAISTLETLVRLPHTWAAAFSGSPGYLLLFSNGGAAVIRQGSPVILSAHEAELNADGNPELAIELASIEGDGYTTVLWVIDGKSRKSDLRVTAVPLGGSSGEPGGSLVDAAWWIEGRTLWIARVQGKKVEYEAYGADHVRPARQTAYAVVAARSQSRDTAERRAVELLQRNKTAARVFPIAAERGAVLWAAGRLFQRHAEAEAWQRAARLPPSAVRSVAATRRGMD